MSESFPADQCFNLISTNLFQRKFNLFNCDVAVTWCAVRIIYNPKKRKIRKNFEKKTEKPEKIWKNRKNLKKSKNLKNPKKIGKTRKNLKKPENIWKNRKKWKKPKKYEKIRKNCKNRKIRNFLPEIIWNRLSHSKYSFGRVGSFLGIFKNYFYCIKSPRWDFSSLKIGKKSKKF